MPSRRQLLAVAAVAVLAPASAWAHVRLIASTPAEGTSATASGFTLELRFNGRLDAARSRVNLVAADGSSRPLAVQPGGDAATLRADVAALPPGRCEVHYTALSTDGHLSTGTLHFTVAER